MLLLQPRYPFFACCDTFLGNVAVGFSQRLRLSFQVRSTISPALEAAIDYQLKVLSVGITYGGPAIIRYKDQFKEAIFLAFDSPSWKVLFSHTGLFLKIS